MSMVEFDQLRVEWAYNPHSKATHAFVKGAATGDGSVCGRATLDAAADLHDCVPRGGVGGVCVP